MNFQIFFLAVVTKSLQVVHYSVFASSFKNID